MLASKRHDNKYLTDSNAKCFTCQYDASSNLYLIKHPKQKNNNIVIIQAYTCL